MKYTVEAVLASGGRLGKLSQTSTAGTIAMETPMCTLFTKGGSAPHLSAVMLQRISQVPEVACMSLGSIASHHENVREFGKGLGEFSAMKDKVIFTTLHDATAAVASGKNDKGGVAVWGKGGKMKLDPQLYMKVQEAFCPDWFQALSDGDTDKTCGKKRLLKAVDRTLDFLDDIVEMKNESEVLKTSSLIGAIEGGYSVEERRRSAKETAARPVDGFLIEGFEKGHSSVDLFADEEFMTVLTETMVHLPDDKPRMMDAVWSPLQVIRAFRLGIDVFSSAYPHTLTEKGFALTADYSLPPTSQPAKLELEGSKENSASSGFYVDLNDKRFFESFSPILPGCGCYTCANFTCSYLHHLLNTSELLAYVLLTIHNFEQYFKFFARLRETGRQDKLSELEQSLARQEGGQREDVVR
ncbi:queuine tRNA-ribosyltransferase accessory subunit 2 isoform X1 [Aplysia californica]|uniref:Queuine tRNA-ribosyltransferase accessory subunit 2 n=1 Tax=Aplysia californica TaxID=6500 RepID=A0ABM1W3V5_APLCA|nr:queuine tRNA-ribosyltransferase accessory subunit 2 isoform X1 [Aplysia californica]XP_035829350.1 queuine tRNA-ribosyltransferase accessory subunit 2 isoform X1 [Aplysia californica]